MKIRWNSGSLRLRITPQELEALLRGEAVAESIHFAGTGSWACRIQPGGDISEATGDGSEFILHLSGNDLSRLAAPDTEGVYFSSTEPKLKFFIEKDFPCDHPRAPEVREPDAQTFDRR
jgi:hypothetical protein